MMLKNKKKVYRKIKSNKKDVSTQPRCAGRPKFSSYKTASASNFKAASKYDIL